LPHKIRRWGMADHSHEYSSAEEKIRALSKLATGINQNSSRRKKGPHRMRALSGNDRQRSAMTGIITQYLFCVGDSFDEADAASLRLDAIGRNVSGRIADKVW
jgi:hypothetical protein